jgi:hypothetical protein
MEKMEMEIEMVAAVVVITMAMKSHLTTLFQMILDQ